jgi:hypothetical protein
MAARVLHVWRSLFFIFLRFVFCSEAFATYFTFSSYYFLCVEATCVDRHKKNQTGIVADAQPAQEERKRAVER